MYIVMHSLASIPASAEEKHKRMMRETVEEDKMKSIKSESLTGLRESDATALFGIADWIGGGLMLRPHLCWLGFCSEREMF